MVVPSVHKFILCGQVMEQNTSVLHTLGLGRLFHGIWAGWRGVWVGSWDYAGQLENEKFE